MTNHQAWLLSQSADFQRGYDAAAANEPRNRENSAEWIRGFDQAVADIERGA